jgi:superfamily I DNA and/or RNA helicase
MSIIFLDFYSNIGKDNKNANSNSNFFNSALEEQFNSFSDKLPLNNESRNLKSFIQACFPAEVPKCYYFSCPSFVKELDQDKNGVQFLNNVIIRPEITPTMIHILPPKMNVILIGDIAIGSNLKSFRVKGLELIDSSLYSDKEIISYNNYVCYAFEIAERYNIKQQKTTSAPVWSNPNIKYEDSYFTLNIIEDLQTSYIVSNPDLVIQEYNKWCEYLNFRNNYLAYRTKRSYQFNDCKFIDAFSVNRQKYKLNLNTYDQHILDNIEEFKKGEQIILDKQVLEAESFPLIRVNINFNKKEFISGEKDTKRGKKNPEEIKIRAFSSENLALCLRSPELNNYDDYKKVFKENSFRLDEKYRLVVHEIEPDYSGLENQFKQKINSSLNSIDNRYKAIKQKESDELLFLEKKVFEEEREERLKKYQLDFEMSLDALIERNADEEISKDFSNNYKQKEDQYKNEINKISSKIINEKDKKTINELNIKLSELKETAKRELHQFTISFDYKTKYLNKHLKKYQALEVQINNEIKSSLQKREQVIKIQLDNKFKNEIETEKEKSEAILLAQKETAIQIKKENETILQFSIFFKVNAENTEALSKKDLSKYKCLVYDNTAESAKIKREKEALSNFFGGYVKNPFLSKYLFNPKSLQPISLQTENWEWYLDKLNENQKLAVRKAVASNGVFLLQGPPGTGKTQVIAEIIGHLIENGKKVLVSSETHKAIDNVFERLPDIAAIRPLRLIPSRTNNKSRFSPENLVDNLYGSISNKMSTIINQYDNFTETKANFNEQLTKIKLSNEKLMKNKKFIEGIKQEIASVEEKIKKINDKIVNLSKEKDFEDEKYEVLIRTKRHLDRNNLKVDEDIKASYINEYIQLCIPSLNNEVLKNDDKTELIRNILNSDNQILKAEIRSLDGNENKLILEAKKVEIRFGMKNCRDENDYITDETKYNALQKELIEINEKIKLLNSNNIDTASLSISLIFALSHFTKLNDKSLILVQTLKEKFSSLKEQIIKKLNEEIEETNKICDDFIFKISNQKRMILELQKEKIKLEEGTEYSNFETEENNLKNIITRFYETFDIRNSSYKTIDEAIVILETEWHFLERDFSNKERENKEKIPVYREISAYLRNENVIKNDRILFTKSLFGKANLFGITCTSRDSFDENTLTDLDSYGLGKIDIKKQGIDVVIIDEVSKSSFLELLIPILYGKTIILVGDHRQLPPMYELKHFNEEDYEDMQNAGIEIDDLKNKEYTELYEECFFKTLYEKVPEDYKVMLNQQYRSHKDIMEVYNCFYNYDLKIGDKAQNERKKHKLNIIGENGRQIISQDKCIYFVNCTSYEDFQGDSTSKSNTKEADVVVELLRKIDLGYQNSLKPKVDLSLGKDERMSIGVICTYGDQARKIKEKVKSRELKFSSFKKLNESYVVSTVDDFQGDERDIIILSMVRNPDPKKRSDPGFINAYQRINVALSRARRLLIIVGNKDYLQNHGVIDLPDVYGIKPPQKDFHLYKEIINQIEKYGKILDDVDIIGSKINEKNN